jgi:hypothetical protein
MSRAFLIPSACAIVLGCQASEAADIFCGDSFCIRSVNRQDVAKSSPVEDFNIYRVSYRDRVYQIYEGNNPRPPGRLLNVLALELPEYRVALYQDGDIIEARFDRGDVDRPFAIGENPPSQFLVISTRCEDSGHCGIEQIARLIRPKGQR